MFKRDTFGQLLIFRKLVVRIFGFITYFRFQHKNTPEIKGAEILQKLHDKNVLFVSNHQTYFADVTYMVHIIESALDGYPNEIKLKSILKCSFVNLFFVAAEETMKSGLLPKILALGGAITIKRTWREAGKEIKRKVDRKDTESIKKALDSGWVILFRKEQQNLLQMGGKEQLISLRIISLL